MQPRYGTNPYSQYKKSQDSEIQMADPIKLVTMLLEGAIRGNKKAILAFEEKNKVACLENIEKASLIVVHLYKCLDFEKGGDISKRLSELYSYVCEQFFVFQKNNENIKPIHDINKVLHTILDGWKQIEKDAKQGQNKQHTTATRAQV